MKIEIALPACKSVVIRQLVIHFVATGEVLLVEDGDARDVLIVARALTSIRDAVEQEEELTTIDVRDCGAAYRFLLPVLAATKGRWLLTGTERLLQRPIEELVGVLLQAGADIERRPDGLHIHGGQLHLEEATIDCGRTSQYASALLMSAPLLGLKHLHIIPEDVRSAGYIELTRRMVETQCIQGQRATEGDWDAALFWYAYALLHQQPVTMDNLSLQSWQSDAIIAEWFEALGVKSQQAGEQVILTPTPPVSAPTLTLDVADHPDTVPVLAVLATLLPADITFLHTRNLAYKESDRIRNLSEQLKPFAEVEVGEDHLRVAGHSDSRERMAGCCFRTWNDHRLAMAFLLAVGPAALDNPECVGKSYPQLLGQLLRIENI
ncbi:MAG: hypothetical protein J6T86_07040 [Bacteroidales bacterium]|nr:hypothetical protein [Bacteroidales bacterium]